MARVPAVFFVLLALVAAAAAADPIVRDKQVVVGATSQIVLNVNEEVVFMVPTVPRFEVERLWNSRSVEVVCEDENYSVFVSDRYLNRTHLMSQVICHIPFWSTVDTNRCEFTISPFGISTLAHDITNEFGERHHYLYITVRNDGSDMMSVEITITEEFDQLYPALLILGVLLYLSAPVLSASLEVYLAGCFALGAIFSAVIVIIVLWFFISKQQISIARILTGALGVGYLVVVRKFVDSFPTWSELIGSKYVIAYLLVGGTLGLWKFYRSSLDDDHIYGATLVVKFVALAMLYNSFQMSEYSFSLCAAIVIFDYFRFSLFTPIFFILRISGILWLLSFVFYVLNEIHWRIRELLGLLPQRDLITMDEYEEQARTYTQKHLDELRQYLRENPTEIVASFDTPRQKQLARFVRNEPDQFFTPETMRYIEETELRARHEHGASGEKLEFPQ